MNNRKILLLSLSLFILPIILIACGSDAISIGDMNATQVAAATEIANEQAENIQKASSELPKYCAEKPDHCIVDGDPDAPVAMFDFFDYGCPACQSLTLNVMPQLKASYIDTGDLVAYELPAAILSNSNNTLQTPLSAQASLCANAQGKGLEYHELLFSEQTPRTDQSIDKLVSFAERIGLDGDAMRDCLDDEEFRVATTENRNLALELGVNSTPTLFVNGEVINGANLVAIQDAIDRNLNR